jgi:sensor histidine kinase regulating citrate/malate metabolism
MNERGLSTGAVIAGFVLGLVIGVVGGLLRLPSQVIRRRAQVLDPEQRAALLKQADPVAQSIEQGRQLANERMQQRRWD